jgi:tRNA (mo5U34)-methyltransferase
MRDPSPAELAVVIPTRRRWDTLRLTLEALRSQSVRGFEIVVVADGTDQAVPALRGVRVVQQEHAGPGAARNRGVAETERPLVLFLGDDMVPARELVARHLERHAGRPEPEVGVLGRIVWHPAVPGDRLHRWLDWSGALFDYALLDAQGGDEAGWTRFYSSNVSLKRELFLAAGGFDPDFVFDYEDLDLGWRLGRHGLRLLYEPAAVAEHLHPYDWAAVQRRYESRAEAERLMMAKHDWFEPWFKRQIDAAARAPRSSRLWALGVDRVPARAGFARRAAMRRADRYYLQRLAPGFRAAWDAAAASGAAAVRACRAMPSAAPAVTELSSEVEAQQWYHTIELAPGVVTPGWFDTRAIPDRLPIPASLDGARCLDVGTFDGFWAFEMERRGADEVIALDVLDPRGWDWPAGSGPDAVEALAARKRGGEGFALARRMLGSSVQRVEQSVYALDPERDGRFDFVYLGSLLLHLRDPVLALERVRAISRGSVLLVDVIDPWLTFVHPRRPVAALDANGRPWWWQANLAGLLRMVRAAGLAPAGRPRLVRMPPGPGQPAPALSPRLLHDRGARRDALVARLGDPHAVILARPR